MLKRENSRYEHIINIQTNEIVPNFNIEVSNLRVYVALANFNFFYKLGTNRREE